MLGIQNPQATTSRRPTRRRDGGGGAPAGGGTRRRSVQAGPLTTSHSPLDTLNPLPDALVTRTRRVPTHDRVTPTLLSVAGLALENISKQSRYREQVTHPDVAITDLAFLYIGILVTGPFAMPRVGMPLRRCLSQRIGFGGAGAPGIAAAASLMA
jgi:hypothetical protein